MGFNVKLFPFKLKYVYQNLITSKFYYNSPASRVLKYSYQSIIIWKTFFYFRWVLIWNKKNSRSIVKEGDGRQFSSSHKLRKCSYSELRLDFLSFIIWELLLLPLVFQVPQHVCAIFQCKCKWDGKPNFL